MQDGKELLQKYRQKSSREAIDGKALLAQYRATQEAVPEGTFNQIRFGLRKGLEQFALGKAQLANDLTPAIAGVDEETSATTGQAMNLLGLPAIAPVTPSEKETNANELTRNVERNAAAIDQLGFAGKAAAMGGEILPTLADPGGAGRTVGQRFLTGLVGNAASNASAPVGQDESRAAQMALGGSFGATGEVAVKGAGSTMAKLQNIRKLPDGDVAKVLATGDSEQVRVFFDDVSESPLAKRMSVAAEIFGILGTGSGRRIQNKEALAAAERWLADTVNDPDLLDYEEFVDKSFKRRFKALKRLASMKYNRAFRLLDPQGPVNTPRFERAIDDALQAEAGRKGGPRSEVVSLLESYKGTDARNFSETHAFRSEFRKEIEGALGTDRKHLWEVFRPVRDALNSDIEEFARGVGGDASAAWRAADRYYAKEIVPYRTGKLKALLADQDGEQAWRYVSATQGGSQRARRMYNALDKNGRAMVRYGLVKEALDAATVEGRPFSPARFANFLEKRKATADQFFGDGGSKEIDGLVKMMRHIERSGQFAENPPTGNRLVPFVLAGGAAADFGLFTGAVAAATAIKTMFQTKAGRDFLVAASTATPGSKRMENILSTLNSIVSRSTSREIEDGDNSK